MAILLAASSTYLALKVGILPSASIPAAILAMAILRFFHNGNIYEANLIQTAAGSLIIATQSGAVWGYKLLALQFVLMPILYIAQELTVRLGITTGMGHGELIKHYFGKTWAWLSVSTLVVSCIGAILTEFSGLAGVGALFNIPAWETLDILRKQI